MAQFNAVHDTMDCYYEMAIQMASRVVSRHYIDWGLR